MSNKPWPNLDLEGGLSDKQLLVLAPISTEPTAVGLQGPLTPCKVVPDTLCLPRLLPMLGAGGLGPNPPLPCNMDSHSAGVTLMALPKATLDRGCCRRRSLLSWEEGLSGGPGQLPLSPLMFLLL